MGLLVLNGCSEDIKSIKITEENKGTIFKDIADKKGLTFKESQQVFSYLLRTSMSSAFSSKDMSLPVGKTIGDLIKEQEEFETKQQAQEEKEKQLAEKTKREEEAKIKKLNNDLTVAVYDKGFSKQEFQNYLTIDLAYKNISKRNIRGFKGQLIFNDLFNDKIKAVNLTVDTPISAGDVLKENRTISFNQFDDDDKKLKNTDLKNLKVVWKPESILYASVKEMLDNNAILLQNVIENYGVHHQGYYSKTIEELYKDSKEHHYYKEIKNPVTSNVWKGNDNNVVGMYKSGIACVSGVLYYQPKGNNDQVESYKIYGCDESSKHILLVASDEGEESSTSEAVKQEKTSFKKASEGRFPELQYKEVDLQDAINYSCREHWIARNEIYARYGKKFTNSVVKSHFESQSWYKVNPNYRDDLLNKIERKNVKSILSIEKAAGCF